MRESNSDNFILQALFNFVQLLESSHILRHNGYKNKLCRSFTVWGMDRFDEFVILVIFHIYSGGFIWKQGKNV